MRRVFFLLLMFFCGLLNAQKKPVVRPDYAQSKFWIALPERKDAGDTIPNGCSIPQNEANAKADVFYINPTVYLSGIEMNADLEDKTVNRKSDECVMEQATAFNACCKVYAPRYRQAVLRAFTEPSAKGFAAIDTAYSDVKKAFEFYLAHYNNGRPIIIAGHSQGAHHAVRVLHDFFEGKPLRKQLVAAYAIGWTISEHAFTDIPACDSAKQTGCFITWNTVLWGVKANGRYHIYDTSICVNPLTWRRDTVTTTTSMHDGGVPFTYNRVDANFLTTQVHGHMLWMKTKNVVELNTYYYHVFDNFHPSDMNLFWMDIRMNAIERVEAFGIEN